VAYPQTRAVRHGFKARSVFEGIHAYMLGASGHVRQQSP
jgi:hypothetical protein